MLYELAALDLPFQARNLPALAHRIMTKEPKPLPSSHRYSTNLKLLTTSLLNKRPALRPSVVAILRSDFVQGHISSLLSHTIKQGTGGMEGDAVNKNGAEEVAKALPKKSAFMPKLPPPQLKQQAREYRQQQAQQQQQQQQQQNRNRIGADQNAARARNVEKNEIEARLRRREHAVRREEAAQKIKREKIRLEKQEVRSDVRSEATKRSEYSRCPFYARRLYDSLRS